METNKISCVLLVDDDSANNFINEKIITLSQKCDQIITMQDPVEALEYLKENVDHHSNFPELILLDINMPKFDGWEFIRKYGDAGISKRRNTIIYFLTTSLNPDDRKRADETENIDGFLEKPLQKDDIDAIFLKHFN